MKKQLILSCLLGMTSVCAMAQLEVDSLGKVVIGENYTGSNPLYIKTLGNFGPRFEGGKWTVEIENNREIVTHTGLRVHSVPYNNAIGIEVLNSSDETKEFGKTIGIKSVSGGTPQPHYSIAGSLIGTNQSGVTQNAIAIYGSTNSTISIPSEYNGLYAGFFRGDVRMINGTLYADILTPAANPSEVIANMSNLDGSTKNGLESEAISNRLRKVSLLQFRREPQHSSITTRSVENVVSEFNENKDKDNILDEEKEYFSGTQLSTVQYGLDVDDLRQVFPELVYEDKKGNVSINYIEMIPLMLQYINELKAEVDELSDGSRTIVAKGNSQKAQMAASAKDETLFLSLGQNNPNPFSEQTSIEVCVPESVTAATLLFFDMQGKQVKKIDISERGISRITVTGQSLTEGMYLYSLVADGKVVQTKKMILSK